MKISPSRFPAPGLLALLLLLASFGAPSSLRAQLDDHHDHDHGSFETPELTAEESQRVNRLFSTIICSCPKENWTLSLNGCPNACADHQKNMVLRAVKEGKSDEQILATQVQVFGPKVVGRTRADGFQGFLVYAGPFILLAAAAFFVIAFIRGVTRRSREAASGTSTASAPAASSSLNDEDRALSDAIDRELENMD